MKKVFEFKNYSNLYKFASIKLNEILNKQDTILICTNCASLIAGLSFNLIKIHNHNLNIIMNKNFSILDKYINLELTNQIVHNFDFYFKYIGNEDGIILCTE